MSDSLPSETPLDRLTLGTDNLGRAWTLDFGTGTVAAARNEQEPVGDDNATLIAGTELNADRLARLFTEGGWRVERMPDEMVRLNTEIGSVCAFVLPDGSEFNLLRVYEWEMPEDGWESPDARSEAEESLCREAFMVRFAALDDESNLLANFVLPLAAGVTRAQLLDTTRRFVAETARAIENASCEGVLK